MSEFQEYNQNPQYEENNNLYQGTDSIYISEVANYKNPTLLSSEMKYDEKDVIIKPAQFAKPKYREVKNTYEVLKPITKEVVELPTKRKKRIKTMEPVYTKTIIVNGKDELNQILLNNNFIENDMNVPIPTASTIKNLCKESLISSSYYYPYEEPKNEKYKNKKESTLLDPNIYETVNPILYDNQSENPSQNQVSNQNENKIQKNPSKNQQMNFQSTNIDYISPKSKISNISNINNYHNSKSYMTEDPKVYNKFQTSNIENIKNLNNAYKSTQIANNQNINNEYYSYKTERVQNPYKIKEPYESKSHKQKFQNFNNINQDKLVYQSKVYQPNLNLNNQNINKDNEENYYEIPKPEVYEGDGLNNSQEKNDLNGEKYSEISNGNMMEIPKNDYNNNKTYTNKSNDIIKQFSKEDYINNSHSKIQQKKTENFLDDLPVERTEIMSKQPSIEMSKVQNMNMQQNLSKTTTIRGQLSSHNSNMEQSKVYKNSSHPPQILSENSSINQMSANQPNMIASNNIYKIPINPKMNFPSNIKVQKLNNYVKNINQPKGQKSIYYSNVYDNDIINDKPIPELSNEQSYEANQSNIYQKSYKNSNINYSNDESEVKEYNNIEKQSVINSKAQNINNIYPISQSKMINSINNKYNINSQNKGPINFNGDRPSFPTASYAGNIDSRATLPINPFEKDEENYMMKISKTSKYDNKVKIIKK